MKTERSVAITRLFDAPRERPKGWAQTITRLDAHLNPKP